MSWKKIALDDPTRKFLGNLRAERKKAGLMWRELSAAICVPLGTVKMYAMGRNAPTLGILMRLSEVLGYDLSDSVNYKVYHHLIYPCDVKRRLRRYDLSYRELAELTGYAENHIWASVNRKPYGSIVCLWSVLEVLRREHELEEFRKRG